MSKIRALLDKAARSLAASERLLDAGDVDFAASRAYYGYFYMAEALLFHEGYSFSRHGQVLAQYGRIFSKTGRMDPRFYRTFIQALSLCQAADHSTNPDMGADTVEELIDEGRAFLDAARGYLKRREAEDANSQPPVAET